jgi:hypothetical protein
MRIKSILSVLIFIVISFSIIFLNSCKDNPLNQIGESEGFDSARFNVRVDTIPFIESLNMYAADTSNLFFYGYTDFAYYNGYSYNRIHFSDGFRGKSIGGTSKNNVYIGGMDYHTGKPRLKKWDGAGLSEIQVIDPTNDPYSLQMMFVKSQNEIWMMAGDKSILRYDGFEFKRYDFDTLQNWSYFLTDENNNLCCVRFRDSSDEYMTHGKFSFKFYKYINENWVYYSYHEYYYPQEETLRPINIGNGIYACSRSGIYKYDGYNYSKTINVNIFKLDNIYYDYHTSNIDNFLARGGINNSYNYNVLHWNGKKWSIENKIQINYFVSPYCFGDKFIAFGSPDYFTLVYFFTKKQ